MPAVTLRMVTPLTSEIETSSSVASTAAKYSIDGYASPINFIQIVSFWLLQKGMKALGGGSGSLQCRKNREGVTHHNPTIWDSFPFAIAGVQS